jgi:hypothetical protein
VGYSDALRPWGMDFTINPNGDLAILSDTPTSPVATTQRIIRLLQYLPLLFNDAGSPITTPDDLFNPFYGAGVRAVIGQNPTTDVISGVRTRILKGLATDPYIRNTPAPTVTVVSGGGNALLTITVSCTTSTGQPVTIPPQQISLAT